MKKKNLMPTSKAKTAYGLLSEIVRLIEAEPRRLRMAQWLTDPKELRDEERPACGTVGCIGGWAIVLKGTESQRRNALRNRFGLQPYHAAARILGLRTAPDGFGGESQASGLFDGWAPGVPGTSGYVRHVVSRIRRFQSQHATQLKAKKV